MREHLKGWLKSGWNETRDVNVRLADRARRWNALYKVGGGTPSDYLYADFNTDCPGGLETGPWAAQQQIKLESLLKSESYKNANWLGKVMDLRWGGHVEGRRDDAIHLNPLWYSPLSLKLRGAVHTLKGQIPVTLSDIIPHEFIHTRQNYSDLSGWPRYNKGNDLKYVGFNDLSKLRRLWQQTARWGHDISTAKRTKTATTSEYFARNVEIQARMHEMMAYGYCQWQTLPTTKTELWAALINMGLETPASILHEVKSTEAGRKALEDFKLLPGIKSQIAGTAGHLNFVHDYAREPDIQEALWTAKYPLLYGELLEFYGDKFGRERMGMGTNPRPAIEVLYALQAHTAPLTQDKSRELASLIPCSVAAAFLNCIITNYPQGAENFDNAMRLSRALLARDDVRAAVFAPDQAIRNYTGQHEDPPLEIALINGHIEMAGILTDAGANPFQQYTVMDMRGKALYTDFPANSVFWIENNEKNLVENPENMPRQIRKFYNDPEFRKNLASNIKERRAVLQEIIDRTDDPEAVIMRFENKGNSREISLSEMLSKIGITKSPGLQKPEMSSDPS
jgi:hypothetical protein